MLEQFKRTSSINKDKETRSIKEDEEACVDKKTGLPTKEITTMLEVLEASESKEGTTKQSNDKNVPLQTPLKQFAVYNE
jgi:hypothetical protein